MKDTKIVIRKDIKPGEYLYSWRHQGYVKVIDLKHYEEFLPRHQILKCIVVSNQPFNNSNTEIGYNGGLVVWGNSDVDFQFPQENARPDYFNDLDQYCEFVKATTNTPIT